MNHLFKFLLNWSRSFLCWPLIHLSTSGFEIWYFFSIKPFGATKIHLRFTLRFTLRFNQLTSVFIQCSVIVKKRFRLKMKMVKLAITAKKTGELKVAFFDILWHFVIRKDWLTINKVQFLLVQGGTWPTSYCSYSLQWGDSKSFLTEEEEECCFEALKSRGCIDHNLHQMFLQRKKKETNCLVLTEVKLFQFLVWCLFSFHLLQISGKPVSRGQCNHTK